MAGRRGEQIMVGHLAEESRVQKGSRRVRGMRARYYTMLKGTAAITLAVTAQLVWPLLA